MDSKKESCHLSVVSPVYGASGSIPELCAQLHEYAGSITQSYEVILVFDCSPDDGWERIEVECEKDSRVKGIRLSRNFGQHYAITAGLAKSSGDWIVVMDCDMQDLPEEIPNLYNKAKEGYDSVFAKRKERQDSSSKRFQSWAFYKIFGYLTDTKMDHSIANFGIYHRKVVDAILSMGDSIRYFPTMSQWVGFRRAYLPVTHGERKEGESSYYIS